MAGKTGTAQVVKLGARRLKAAQIPYFQRDHAWFAAFAPAAGPGDRGGGAERALGLRLHQRRPDRGRAHQEVHGAQGRRTRRRATGVGARPGAGRAAPAVSPRRSPPRHGARQDRARRSGPWHLTLAGGHAAPAGVRPLPLAHGLPGVAISGLGVWNLASASRSAHAPVWISQAWWMGIGVAGGPGRHPGRPPQLPAALLGLLRRRGAAPGAGPPARAQRHGGPALAHRRPRQPPALRAGQDRGGAGAGQLLRGRGREAEGRVRPARAGDPARRHLRAGGADPEAAGPGHGAHRGVGRVHPARLRPGPLEDAGASCW